jgi:hypothetical protein
VYRIKKLEKAAKVQQWSEEPEIDGKSRTALLTRLQNVDAKNRISFLVGDGCFDPPQPDRLWDRPHLLSNGNRDFCLLGYSNWDMKIASDSPPLIPSYT